MITNHTAETGSHYIAATSKDYMSMFWRASGGGVIVGALCVLKLLYGYIPGSDLKPSYISSGNPDPKLVPPVIDITVQPSEARLALISWTALPVPTQGAFHIERKDPSSSWCEIKQLPFNAPMPYTDTGRV